MTKYIFISCSDKKKEGGKKLWPGNDFDPWIPNFVLLKRLFETRKAVFDLIKANKLIDSEKRQGLRGNDPRNKGIIEGPDFGSSNYHGEYLPAYLRYTGRFFRTIRDASSEAGLLAKWQRGCTPPYRTFILSALYGILSPFDQIQEYTCHFADRIIDNEKSLKQIWQPILTDIILELIEKGPKPEIVDLLSEEAYQEAIEWKRIYPKANCYHRTYKLKAGPETLINTANFYLNEILESKSDLRLKSNSFITKEYFDDPEDKLLFESEYGTSAKVTREGVREVIPALKAVFGPIWDRLDEEVRNQIANSESSFIRNGDLSDYDFTSSAISLSKAIEIWIHNKVLNPLCKIPGVPHLLRYDRDHIIPPKKATLGNISNLLKYIFSSNKADPFLKIDILKFFPNTNSKYFLELAKYIDEIAEKYRNGWVHHDTMPRSVYIDFRTKAIEFFNKYGVEMK